MNRLVLLLFSLCIGSSNLTYAMSQAQFETCKRIKEMPLDASDKDYNSLAQNLKQAGVSTSACVRALVDSRIKDAMKLLRNQWGITQKHWDEIASFNKAVAKKDAQSTGAGEIDYSLLNKDLPKKQKKYLEDMFEKALRDDVQVNVIDALDEFDDTVIRRMNAKTDADGIISPYSIKPNEYYINLPKDYFQFNDAARKGFFLHLFGRLQHSDPETNNFLVWNAGITTGDPTLFKEPSKLYRSDSFLNYHRSTLARADQIPAVNGTVQEAQCIEEWLAAKAKQQPNNKDLVDRRDMLTRICNLMQAEARMTKAQA